MDFYDAELAVKRASIAASIIILITFIKFFGLLMSDDPQSIVFLQDPFNYLDIVIIIISVIMIRRYSRTAAILLLTQFVTSKALQINQNPEILNSGAIIVAGLVSLVIVIFYINGIRATYAYHRLKKQENPEYKPAAKWSYYIGLPIMAIIFLFIGIALLAQYNGTPSTEVISGQELGEDNYNLLIKERIIDANENIKMFYSAGLFSILDDGNILTEKRVISYEMINGMLDVYSTSYEDIEKVSIIEQGNYLSDTIVEVLTKNGSFHLLLSTENNGDKRFIDAIKNYIL